MPRTGGGSKLKIDLAALFGALANDVSTEEVPGRDARLTAEPTRGDMYGPGFEEGQYPRLRAKANNWFAKGNASRMNKDIMLKENMLDRELGFEREKIGAKNAQEIAMEKFKAGQAEEAAKAGHKRALELEMEKQSQTKYGMPFSKLTPEQQSSVGNYVTANLEALTQGANTETAQKFKAEQEAMGGFEGARDTGAAQQRAVRAKADREFAVDEADRDWTTRKYDRERDAKLGKLEGEALTAPYLNLSPGSTAFQPETKERLDAPFTTDTVTGASFDPKTGIITPESKVQTRTPFRRQPPRSEIQSMLQRSNQNQGGSLIPAPSMGISPTNREQLIEALRLLGVQ